MERRVAVKEPVKRPVKMAGQVKGGSAARIRHWLRGVAGLKLTSRAPLAPLTTFRIGGAAELLAEVGTEAALAALLTAVAEVGCPFQILGLGSNILIPDRGLPGVVAKLSGHFRRLRFDGNRVVAGAALALPSVAKQAAQRGLSGLEALAGFPSTVGGAVWMNAGCYGVEIKDVLISAWLMERDGSHRRIGAGELEAGYRTTALQHGDSIVTRASFRLHPADPAACLARIEQLNRKRWASLPSGRTAGSTFKNPPGDFAGRLIEACGLKGKAKGGAAISPQHANVLINLGDARAEEVLDLMIEARHAVHQRFGITLEAELVLLGELGRRWRESVP